VSAAAVIMNQPVDVRLFPDALLADATYLNAAEADAGDPQCEQAPHRPSKDHTPTCQDGTQNLPP
jgi:hypothetical protein